MILRVFTKGDGPESRDALELAERVKEGGYDVEYYDLEETESDSLRELYDLYADPSFVIVQNDGKIIEIWKGETPTESALNNYMRL